MSGPQTRYELRGTQFIRQWKLLVLLRQMPRTLDMLAVDLGCSTRTIRRDLAALTAVPFPIVSHRHSENCNVVVYRLGFVPEWPRREATPIYEVRRAG